MKLKDIISERSVSAELASTDKARVLEELSGLLAGVARGARIDDILETLAARERVASTGIGEGVAIPHGKLPGIARVFAAVGISHDGVPFDAIDGAKVNIFVALLSPEGGAAGDHLRVLARLSRALRDPAFRAEILAQRTAAGILAAFATADWRD